MNGYPAKGRIGYLCGILVVLRFSQQATKMSVRIGGMRTVVVHRSSRSGAMMGVLVVAGTLTGCVPGAPETALPPLGKDTRPVLNAEQQKAAAIEMAAKREAEHAKALKKIEAKR